MLFGRLKLSDEDKDDGGVEVMIMLGRFHLYEGYTIDQASLKGSLRNNKTNRESGKKVFPRLRDSPLGSGATHAT